MTSSGYDPTAMPAAETRHVPREPDFGPRSTDSVVAGHATSKGD